MTEDVLDAISNARKRADSLLVDLTRRPSTNLIMVVALLEEAERWADYAKDD